MAKKQFIFVFTIVLTFMFICACQANPSRDIVTSKNDGKFEKIIQEDTNNQEAKKHSVSKDGTFSSTDGSVNFTWKIDQSITEGDMPVLEMAPHFLSGKDVQHIAEALFGDEVIFYDLGPASKRGLSKSAILKRIQVLSQYSSEDALKKLMGDEANIDSVKFWLEHYTIAYETAPENNPLKECDWTLKDRQYYEDNGTTTDLNSDWLLATANVDGYNYLLRTYVHNDTDYQENALYVTLGDGIDDTYVPKKADIAKLCCTDKPTEDQIDKAKETAQEMLNNMGLGSFVIAESFIEEQYFGDTPAYQIRLDAVPVFEGKPALYGDFGRSYIAEEAYNSTYPVGQTQFFFSANGDLISFGIHSLVEVKAVKNTNVAVLPIEEIIDKAQTHMALYDALSLDRFTGNAFMMEALTGRDASALDCKVEITKLDYGLARFPIPDSSNFYYAPAVVFYGTIDYCDPNTGDIITGTGNPYGTRLQSLVVINAVDGTVY